MVAVHIPFLWLNTTAMHTNSDIILLVHNTYSVAEDLISSHFSLPLDGQSRMFCGEGSPFPHLAALYRARLPHGLSDIRNDNYSTNGIPHAFVRRPEAGLVSEPFGEQSPFVPDQLRGRMMTITLRSRISKPKQGDSSGT